MTAMPAMISTTTTTAMDRTASAKTTTTTTTIPTSTSTPTLIGKKRALPVSDRPAPAPTSTSTSTSTLTPVVLTSASALGLPTAGHDDDGEEILVEEDPLPHEIASDPALRCRYPSKHCLRTRTVKKTGALHSMCAFHRAKANRNQRRLEKRKRERLRAASGEAVNTHPITLFDPIEREAAPLATAVGMASFSPELKFTELLDFPTPSLHRSPRQVSADLEPFRTPTPLCLEDVEELYELVDVAVKQEVVVDGDDLLESALRLFVDELL